MKANNEKTTLFRMVRFENGKPVEGEGELITLRDLVEDNDHNPNACADFKNTPVGGWAEGFGENGTQFQRLDSRVLVGAPELLAACIHALEDIERLQELLFERGGVGGINIELRDAITKAGGGA
jgi:hypothetical protein